MQKRRKDVIEHSGNQQQKCTVVDTAKQRGPREISGEELKEELLFKRI